MRYVMGIAAFMGLTSVAVAQPMPQGAPPGADPATGTRPGGEIGTGASGPFSNNASNIGPQDTRSTIAPNLPAPDVGPNAPPRAFLVAARSALLAGRTGEAQQALEMADDADTGPISAAVPDRSTQPEPAGRGNPGSAECVEQWRSGTSSEDHRSSNAACGLKQLSHRLQRGRDIRCIQPQFEQPHVPEAEIRRRWLDRCNRTVSK